MKNVKTIAILVSGILSMGWVEADINAQLASLQAQVNQLQAQMNASQNFTGFGNVGVSPTLSWQMMSNQSGVGKELNLLNARNAGLSSLTLGGFFESDLIYQHANSTGLNNTAEFNLVPMSNGAVFNARTGSSASQLFLSNVDLAATANLNSWMMAYVQTGAQNVSSANPNPFGIQDAYLVAGNLTKNPLYGFIGKKEIDFGQFASVNLYNSPITRDFFEAVGNTAGIGFNAYGLNAVASFMNGGSNGVNLYTNNSSNINNYAFNIGYGASIQDLNWNVGAGYLNGSRFLNSNNQTDGLWDINGKASIAGFDLLAEFVASTSKSYGATAYNPNLSSTATTINAWDLGADYHIPLLGMASIISIDYSQGNMAYGSSNLLKQFVAGYRIEPFNNVWTGIEYSYNINGINPMTGSFYGSNYHSNTILWDVTAAF